MADNDMLTSSGDLAMCVAPGPSGLDPSGGLLLPDDVALDAAASGLQTHGEQFLTATQGAASSWIGIEAAYQSDEAAIVHRAFDSVVPKAQVVEESAVGTAAALSAFADTVRELRTRLRAYTAAVLDLEAAIAAAPTEERFYSSAGGGFTSTRDIHWSDNEDLVNTRNDLSGQIGQIHADYDTAQNTCAAAIAVVSGGATHSVPQREAAPDLRSGNWFDEFFYDAATNLGVDRGQQMPWGKDVMPYRGGDLAGTWGFLSGAVGLADGLLSMTFTGNQEKRDLTYGALNQIGADALTVAKFWSWGEERAAANERFAELGQAAVYADDWDDSSDWATGGVLFGVASLAAPGVGVATKPVAAVGRGTTAVSSSVSGLATSAAGSTRFAAAAPALTKLAIGLENTGTVLSKPGSLPLKLSATVMPETTANVLNGITRAKTAAWDATYRVGSDIKTGAGAVAHAVQTTTLRGGAAMAHAVDSMSPQHPVPAGVAPALPSRAGEAAFRWERQAEALSSGRAEAAKPSTPPVTPAKVDEPKLPPPPVVEKTVVLRYNDPLYPVSKRDTFTTKTNLAPNTEYVVEKRMPNRDPLKLDAVTQDRYFTDEHGVVNRVDTVAGVRGGWNPELNRPVPNVTYNVVAHVDNNLKNVFSMRLDDQGGLTASGDIRSTLVGPENRNKYQQWKVGRLGGEGYQGGHAAPSALGFPGERIGLFPQEKWQNTGQGTPNDPSGQNFHRTEMEILQAFRRASDAGQSPILQWSLQTLPSGDGRIPREFLLRTQLSGDAAPRRQAFNNLRVGE